jgi:NAD(P)-dependent dehydrogenase (short-subunit alcohol dehydrogenase family)
MPTLVITGTNRGIGLEFVRQYASDGWTVFALNRSRSEDLAALAEYYPIRLIDTSLTDDSALRKAVEAITSETVDLLINNAGTMGNGVVNENGMEYQKFGSFDRKEWHEVFDINVFTPMAMSELLIDKLKGTGKIVTISSMLGSNEMNAFGTLYAYRASKASVNSIMKSLGVNLKKQGVATLAIHPGWVKTDMGGPNAEVSVADSVSGMRSVIDKLSLKETGSFKNYEGKNLPW